MAKTDSDTFPDALRKCGEEMCPCLAKLLLEHGAFFWIGLTAIVGEDLWVLLHNGGCTAEVLERVLERIRPGSMVSGTCGQLKHSVMAGMFQITKLGDKRHKDGLRRAERAIRALGASMGKTHEPLIVAITMGTFLQPAFEQMLCEDGEEMAQHLWTNICETAKAPELRPSLVSHS